MLAQGLVERTYMLLCLSFCPLFFKSDTQLWYLSVKVCHSCGDNCLAVRSNSIVFEL